MHFNTDNAEALIYCRETGNQISFPCNCDLDCHDIGDLLCFFEDTMSTDDARNLAYDFEMFHGHVNYDRVVMDSTDENDLWRKISTELTVNGYDLTIYNITYE